MSLGKDLLQWMKIKSYPYLSSKPLEQKSSKSILLPFLNHFTLKTSEKANPPIQARKNRNQKAVPFCP
jgi:hypothetical protein